MKKLIALLLVLVMVFGLVACGAKDEKPAEPAAEETKTEEKKEEKKEEATAKEEKAEPGIVKILATPLAGETDPSQMEFLNEMEEALNVKLEWEIVTDAESVVSTQIAAGGVDADIFFCGSISGEVLANSGTVVCLSDYFDSTLAETAAVIESSDYIKKAVTCADGKVYWLPKYYNSTINTYPMIRQDWLDKLGLEMPTTLDEFYDVLVAFRDGDPNGNGIADEIPWDPVSTNYAAIYTSPFFGIKNAACWYWMGLNENDEIYCYLDTDNYKALMTFLNKCFEEGLINGDLANSNADMYNQNVAANKVGFSAYASYTMGLNEMVNDANPDAAADYEFMFPPKTEFGTTGVRIEGISSTLHYISSKGENTEDALRVFNYCYTHGRDLWCGTEGEDYTVNADGTLAIGPKYDGMELSDIKTAITEAGQGAGHKLPIFVDSQAYLFNSLLAAGGEKHIAALNEYDASSEVVHQSEVPFRFLPEEVERLAEIQGNYQTFVLGELAKFITGNRSMDEWDDFIATLKSEYYLDEIVSLYANCYARG